jgi:hypothetical protein
VSTSMGGTLWERFESSLNMSRFSSYYVVMLWGPSFPVSYISCTSRMIITLSARLATFLGQRSYSRKKRKTVHSSCRVLKSENILQPVRLAANWWLVLVCFDRKILLAGCWWLICYERKVLLAGGWQAHHLKPIRCGYARTRNPRITPRSVL